MQSYLKGNAVEDVLRKQYFRVPASIPGSSIIQEENASIPFQHQLFAEDFISNKISQFSDFTSDYVIQDASAIEYYPDISFGRGDMAEYRRNEIQHLERWVDLVLKPLPQPSNSFSGTIATTYTRFAKSINGRQDPLSICLLSNTIPANFSNINPDYRYQVKINDILIPPADPIYKWYFDTGTGLLTFYGRVPKSTDSVKISFTRYIGSKGIDTLSLSQFENVVDEFSIRHYAEYTGDVVTFPTEIIESSYKVNGTNSNGRLRILNKYDYGEYSVDVSPYDSTSTSSKPSFVFSEQDMSFVELNGFIPDDDPLYLIVEENKKIGVVQKYTGALLKIVFPSFIRLRASEAAITADVCGNTLRDFNVYGLNSQNVWILLESITENEADSVSITIENSLSKVDIKGIAFVFQRLNQVEDAGDTLKFYNLRFHGIPRTQVSNVFGLENTILGINQSQKIGFGRLDPEYNLDVSGDIRATGNFIVDNQIDVSGDMNVYGTFNMVGIFDISGGFDVSGDIITQNDLSVGGDVDVSGGVDISGAISTVGNLSVGGDVDISGGVDISGAISTKENLSVGGDADISGNIDVSGSITTQNDLSVGGDTDISGNIDVSGSITTQNDLSVGGDTDISGNIDVSGSITTQNDLSVGGDVDISGNVDVSGSITTQKNLSVRGDTDISGNIDVSGSITTQNDLSVGGDTDISGNIDVSGSITTQKNLSVRGNIDLSGDFNIVGDVITTGQITSEGGFVNLSDQRVKTDIDTIEGATSKVRDLRGVYYTMNGSRHVGVVAQELNEIIPEAVFKMNNGYYGVEYGNLVGLLIQGFKEQDRRIKDLEQKLAEVLK